MDLFIQKSFMKKAANLELKNQKFARILLQKKQTI